MKIKFPRVYLIIFVVLVIMVASLIIRKNTGQITQIITIKEGVFEPSIITVSKGTRVIFKNLGSQSHWPASDLHPTHGIYPEFDSTEGIDPGKQWGFIFEKVGVWRFHDHLVPQMKGKIIVVNEKN